MSFVLSNSEWQLIEGANSWPLKNFVQSQRRPFYVYDLSDARERARAFQKGGARVHFAIKANSHPRLLKLLKNEGLGADVVTLGELQKVLALGFEPKDVIFSGVGKGREELAFALQKRIFQINVESFEELQLLARLAKERGQVAEAAIRINVHITAPTHKNIQTATEESKFGLDIRQLPEVLTWLKGQNSIALKGLAVHVGSQIMDVNVFQEVSRKMGDLYREVQSSGFSLGRLDLGGGLGIDYHQGGEQDLARLPDYFKANLESHKTDAQILLEPGRFLVARMGVLMAQVIHVKRGVNLQFAILNAGMNALMRPALYQAFHRIEPIVPRSGPRQRYNVVGPLCESTDIFGEGRELPELKAEDWVAIFDAGAYGAVMANTYNESGIPAQWSLLDGQLEVL